MQSKELIFVHDGCSYVRVESKGISPRDGTEKTAVYWGIPDRDELNLAQESIDLLESEYKKYMRNKKLERICKKQ